MKDWYMIVSGKVKLRFKSADIFVSGHSVLDYYESEIFADELYQESFESGCYTQEEMEDLLIKRGWWSEGEDEQLKALPENLEQMKMDYYNNFHITETREKVRGFIEKTFSKISSLVTKKNIYYENTCEGISEAGKHDFLIERATFYEDGTKFDFREISPRIVSGMYHKNSLGSDKIRQVSKNDRWRAIWSTCKEPYRLFGRVCDMTDMQISLLNWSRVYDNVYESIETPAEEIIEDDLALDGWFVAQRRKREESLKGDRADDLASKLKGAGEIFIPAVDDEDAKRIQRMNTGAGKAQSDARFKELKEKGAMEEQDFNVVRRELAMAGTRLAAQTVKGR